MKNPKPIAKSIHKANHHFKLYFKIGAIRFLDPILSAITNRFEINIVNFDDWLHKQGYIEEEHGSMREYIMSIYGIEATKYIGSLLTSKPRVIKRRKNKE